MRPSALPVLAFSSAIVFSLGACGLNQTASRTEPTQFLKSTGVDRSLRAARLPFEHSWRDPSVDMAKYKHMVVRPVTTSYLRSELWEQSKSTAIPSRRAYQMRCRKLARHWDRSLDQSFSSPICMFYKTNDTTKAGTLVLEVALTEVRFEQEAGSDATIPNLPICAFESRTRDAATGRLISTASDRRGPGLRSPHANASSLTSNEAICDEWSQQLMQRSNREIFPVVKRRLFSLF